MKKTIIILLPLILFSVLGSKVNSQVLNTFPATGKVGIGPECANLQGNLILNPQDLLHIQGFFPNAFNPWFTYMEPTLRISLEEQGACPSRIYGLLSLQNSDEFGANPPTAPRQYSSFSHKYDFVLSTTETFNPSYENDLIIDQVTHLPTANYVHPYNYDLIVTAKNPRASLRFGTTPPPGKDAQGRPLPVNSPGIVSDLERMTILNNGNVGVETMQSNIPGTSLTNASPIPIKAVFQVGNVGIQPCSFGSTGTWGSISYNNWWDPTGTPTGRRIKDGASNGIVFQPESPDHSTNAAQGEGHNGGVYMYASPAGHANDGPINGTRSSSFLLQPEKLLLYIDDFSSNQDHWTNLMEYKFDDPLTPRQVNGSTVREGTLRIKDKIFIGDADPGSSQWHPPFGTIYDYYKLAVDGAILTKELVVDASAFPDYVFDKNYDFLDINELEKYVKTNQHLPGMPTAKEIQATGMPVGEMYKKILEKVEELTLYVIELKKENDALKEEIKRN